MKALLSIIAVTALFLGQCGENEVFVGEKKFTLKEGESYDAGKFTLQLVSIEDSRCPANANCVWEGAAVTTLALWEDHQSDLPADTLETCLGGCAVMGIGGDTPDVVGFEINGVRYELDLEEVLPLPSLKTKDKPVKKKAIYVLRSVR